LEKTKLAAGNRLHLLVAVVNLGWAIWALAGGIVFLKAKGQLGSETTLSVFHAGMHGYELVGIALVTCGVVSLLSVAFRKLAKLSAILCAVWCAGAAWALIAATAKLDQGDLDAWLLMMCSFTCLMRWGLLVLEPDVCQ
jgi:hypothetical protein